MMILNKTTLRKRRNHLRWIRFKQKIKRFITKRRAKRIVDALRKHYIKTGNTVQVLMQHDYRFDLEPALDTLCAQNAISYKYNDELADRIYSVTIKEKQND